MFYVCKLYYFTSRTNLHRHAGVLFLIVSSYTPVHAIIDWHALAASRCRSLHLFCWDCDQLVLDLCFEAAQSL